MRPKTSQKTDTDSHLNCLHQDCGDNCCISNECRLIPNCQKRSSQTLAAAEVVTAPIAAPALQQQPPPVTADISLTLNNEEENQRGIQA